MLVVSSNWCVSDGTLSAGLPRACIARFRAEVRRASLRCGFRRDGRYRPVDAIDVVLAGDTFDWLVSREWTGNVRPWDGGRSAADARRRVEAGAAGQARRLLAALAAWMRRGIDVPVADRRGRPMPTASYRVPLRVAVLCGDRDRWLEQAAHGWMASSPPPMVGRCWSDGGVTVRHGEDMDVLHATGGSEPTIGESLAVDLIARFGASLDDIAAVRPLAGDLVRRLACGSPIDAATTLARWLAAHEHGTPIPAAARQRLIDAWHRSVARWHRAARRLAPRGEGGVDLVGRIAEWLGRDGSQDRGTFHLGIDAFPGPGLAFPWDAAATVVLGHPAADAEETARSRRQVVCLGAGGLLPKVRLDDDLQGPSAVVIRPDTEGRLFEWLPTGAAGSIGCRMDDEPGHGVWLSAASLGRVGIVDAA